MSNKHTVRDSLMRGTALAAIICGCAVGLAPDASAQQEGEAIETVVVTGVLHNMLEGKAPISVTTLNSEDLQKKVPISAADILAEIPGVTVTTDAGESKNTVVTRGLSYGTSSNTAGYYWVKLVEDGMPVIAEPFSNFMPDEFLRSDIMTKTVQAINGGSGAITGPNAPSGIFNYISRNGFTDDGTRASVRIGYEGENGPYTKADFYHGEDNGNWAWSVGGHFRRSYGYRPVAYPTNRGGQFKANLNYNYGSSWGSGTLQFRFKYLDDIVTNLDYFKPLAYGWGSTKFTSQFGRTANFVVSGNVSETVCDPNTPTQCSKWNPRDGMHSKMWSYGVDWNHDFGNGLTFSNNVVAQRSQAFDTYMDSVAYQSVTTSSTFDNMGRTMAGLNKVAGYFTIYDRSSGDTVATVNQTSAGSLSIGTTNNLPNNTLQGNSSIATSNLIMTAAALNARLLQDNVMDLMKLTKSWDDVTFVVGGWYLNSLSTRYAVFGGRSILPLQNQPTTYGVTFTTTATSTAGGAKGTVYQFSNGGGWGAVGSTGGYDQHYSSRLQELSPLLGLTWEPKGGWLDGLLVDGGIRYSYIHLAGENDVWAINSNATSRSFGGLDGNTSTIYDNVYALSSSSTKVPYSWSYDFLQYSGAAGYMIDDHNSFYFRYTYGKKNTEGFWTNLDSTWRVGLSDPSVTSVITQYELQYRMRYRGLTLTPTLYMTDLNKVNSTSTSFYLADGVTHYSTPVAYNHFKIAGIEIDASVSPSSWLTIHNTASFIDSRSLKVATWHSGDCNGVATTTACIALGDPRLDDYVTYGSGPMERSAKFQDNLTVNVDLDPVSFYYRLRYISHRPTTYAALAYLPTYRTSDVGATWDINENYQATFNINNVFDNINVTQISQVGSLPTGVTLDQFIEAYPNALVSVQTNAPRSFWLTIAAKW
jgi:iron complex outermembrane recepter protein